MEEKNEDDFYCARKKLISNQLDKGENLYPHKFFVEKKISEAYEIACILPVDTKSEKIISVAGRIMAIRSMGRLGFCILYDNGNKIQIIINTKEGLSETKNKSSFTTLKQCMKEVRNGDIIGVYGYPGRSKTNEPSIYAMEVTLLAPCLRTITSDHFGIKDPEIIYRKRYLDLIYNEDSRNRFITRAKIINEIRSYLIKNDFIEVETPMMNLIAGGAAAKPFITHHNDLKLDLFLRIAPELYLKQLIVGGMNRVFEIGKNYRNEGIDLTHNPEFTSCEFYMAYADYYDLIRMTEEMIYGIVKTVNQSETVIYKPNKRGSSEEEININFKRPFNIIQIVPELNKQLKTVIQKWKHEADHKYLNNDFVSNFSLAGNNLDEMLDFLVFFIEKENLGLAKPYTLPRVLDKLIGEYIEPQCTNPTFLVEHPLAMSPLAKKKRDDPFLTERFELFINGKEICNAYTELNDPFDQKKRFEEQVKDSEAGDEEAMKMDASFITALEYGLPPTGGWGIGIDRFVMFLTNAANIRDVILFPTMRPEQK